MPLAIIWTVAVLIALLLDSRALGAGDGFIVILLLGLPHIIARDAQLVGDAVRAGRGKSVILGGVILALWMVWFTTRVPLSTERINWTLATLYVVPLAMLGWRRAIDQGGLSSWIGNGIAQVFLVAILGLVGWLHSGPQTAGRQLSFVGLTLLFVSLPLMALVGWALWTGRRKTRS